MHIPDGFISNPINFGAAVVTGGTLAVALWRANKSLGERQAPVLGVTGAFIFAAQMLNFPVAAGTTGHFAGAALAAILLGPFNGFIVMALVLTLQCLLFNDGGLTALGSNIFNLGLIGCFVGYGVYAALRAVLPDSRKSTLAAAGVASWLSLAAASVTCSLMLAGSGTVALWAVLPAMTAVHAVIGLGEALITVGALAAVMQVRPELLARPARASEGPSWSLAVPGAARVGARYALGGGAIAVGLAAAAVLALFSPFAATSPDGLERVAADTGFEEAAQPSAWQRAPMDDYQAPGVADESAATAIAGVAGVAVMFALFVGLGAFMRRKELAGDSPEA